MRLFSQAIALFLVMCFAAGPSFAQSKRVALVIGNSAYAHTSPLANPENDAADIAGVLAKLGFTVVEGRDLDKVGMDRIVNRFSEALAGAEVALFFYAGHSLQVDGENYLIPTDAKLTAESAIDVEATRLDLIQRTMEQKTFTSILLLDACRDNTLVQNLGSVGRRRIERGFAPVSSGAGTLISFSTQPGDVALDGAGRNSPYSAALLKHIATPGEDLQTIFTKVRNDVIKETQYRQVPWEHSALRSAFSFAPLAKGASDLVQIGAPAKAAPPSEAAEAWERTKDATIPGLEAFLQRFENTPYGDLARARLRELEAKAAAASPPVPAAAPPEAKAAAAAVAAPPVRKDSPPTGELARFGDFEAPDIVFVGKSFAVSISLREERPPDQAEVQVQPGRDARLTDEGKLAFEMPQGRDVWEIDVDLTASGFTPSDGTWTRRIKVPRKGDSDVARFVLTPSKLGGVAKRGRWLHARLYHEGRFLGSLSRPIEVRNRIDSNPGRESKTAKPTKPAKVNATLSSQPVVFASKHEHPDLDVTLQYEMPDRLGPGVLTMRSPYFGGQVSVQIRTPPELRSWLDHEYERLIVMGERIAGGKATKEQTIVAVRAIGRRLWREYVPDQLKAVILKLEAAGHLESLQITSNSPVLPWEIVLPERHGAGKEPEFLGIAYRLGRWSPRHSVEQLDYPVKSLILQELHAIAPNYKGGERLDFQKVEMDSLRAAKGFREHKGDFATVKRLIGEPIIGVVHFTGHGDDRSARKGQALYSIRLVDATIDPPTWSEFARRRTGGHPFFFFNACATGRGRSFGGFVQGWGPAILETGAGGFIGGHWSLLDHSAAQFSKQFYGRMMQTGAVRPHRVADILKQVRGHFYATGDPTFLAYAFYGDANLSVSLPDE
jgi:caspase domain-containing protein/CHAT domain-containing protein